MTPLILSGGSGSRLWPISRENYPKQFCELFDQSFLRNTYLRVKNFGTPRIVTLETMAALTQTALGDLGFKEEHLILEPIAKNTAIAIARALDSLKDKVPPDEVIGVFPADHLITEMKAFSQAIHLAEQQAKLGFAVTLGVQPRHPSTSFGYIEVDSTSNPKKFPEAFKVKKFIEKPNLEKAESYLQTGRHFWNSGIFFFTIETAANLFKKYMPEMWKKIETINEKNIRPIYANIRSQSIDYGVMEKAEKLVCIPGDYGWSDVGSWDELARLEDENDLKVDSKALVFNEKSQGNFIFSNRRKVIGLVDVRDLVVVETPDALLVSKRGSAEKVRGLIQQMQEAGRTETTDHVFEVRPWGRFEVLSDAKDCKVKRLTVDVGCQLSMQRHTKRDEHWIVVSGIAEVVMDGTSKKMIAGEQFFVKRGIKHRLRNAGDVPLHIIEVQLGDYFGEDDIERFEDDYNRV